MYTVPRVSRRARRSLAPPSPQGPGAGPVLHYTTRRKKMDKLFTYIRVTRTHLHVGVSHSCKPVCDSVHVPAQAMNSINPGVKWWKEPSLIAFFG